MLDALTFSKGSSVAFVSDMRGTPWGGSEELWSQAALDLRHNGVPVSACVRFPPPRHPKVEQLLASGIDVLHQVSPSVWRRGVHRLLRSNWDPLTRELHRWLRNRNPSLVVLNSGWAMPDPELMEMCVGNRWPFITVSHVNTDQWWPHDQLRGRYAAGMNAARKCYFVSRANLELAHKQFGFDLAKAAVVRNPFGVPYDIEFSWPRPSSVLRMACVGRLEPGAKGQDILIEALSTSEWKHRSWQLNIYGDGPAKRGLSDLIALKNLEDRVFFRGHQDPMLIWKENEVLIQPSRYEGLPITIVEAMLCGRPVLVTPVGGNSELIEDEHSGFVAEAATQRHLGLALEQLWKRRDSLPEMGKTAAASVRKSIERHPAKTFVGHIGRLLEAISEPAKCTAHS